MRILRLLPLLACVAYVGCGLASFGHRESSPGAAGPDPSSQLPGHVRTGVVTGSAIMGCAGTGAPLEADVVESDELDGHIIAAVLRVVNLGDEPAQALHAFDLEDGQQRLFNMADRIVFPGYPAVERQALAAWPDLQVDAALIEPGGADDVLVTYKVAPDSRTWELTAAPIEQNRCKQAS